MRSPRLRTTAAASVKRYNNSFPTKNKQTDLILTLTQLYTIYNVRWLKTY